MSITRQEAHAEGVRFLREAFEQADQAAASFRDATSSELVATRMWGRYVSLRDMMEVLEAMLRAAEHARCDNCEQLVADCACDWAYKPVRS